MNGEELARAKRERIMAVSRTVHSIPEEEGGMLKRRAAPPLPTPRKPVWRSAAMATGGAAALAMALLAALRRRR